MNLLNTNFNRVCLLGAVYFLDSVLTRTIISCLVYLVKSFNCNRAYHCHMTWTIQRHQWMWSSAKLYEQSHSNSYQSLPSSVRVYEIYLTGATLRLSNIDFEEICLKYYQHWLKDSVKIFTYIRCLEFHFSHSHCVGRMSYKKNL